MWDADNAWMYFLYALFSIGFFLLGKIGYHCLRYFDRLVGPYVTALLYLGVSMFLMGGLLQLNSQWVGTQANSLVQSRELNHVDVVADNKQQTIYATPELKVAAPALPQPSSERIKPDQILLVEKKPLPEVKPVKVVAKKPVKIAAKYRKPVARISSHTVHTVSQRRPQCRVSLDISERSLPWEAPRFSKYDRYFKKYARKYFGPEADWRWFKVQAYVESSFNARATSRSGAAGVMQILPSTYQEIVRMNPFFKGKSVYDAEWNIAAGIYYNRYLLRQWNKIAAPEKRLQLMFASYNAGFGRIRRMFDEYELTENQVLVSFEEFPDETARYMAKMTRLMTEYRGIAFTHTGTSCVKPHDFEPLLLVASL